MEVDKSALSNVVITGIIIIIVITTVTVIVTVRLIILFSVYVQWKCTGVNSINKKIKKSNNRPV